MKYIPQFLIAGLIMMVSIVMMGSCGENLDRCAEPDLTRLDQAQLALEIQALDDTLTARGIPFTTHPSGLRYHIVQPGDGIAILNMCNGILVHYRGRLIDNGTQFDTSYTGPPASFNSLNSLIVGWQIGIPIIRVGGIIELYIPASLAYGERGVRSGEDTFSIPPNSNLHFTIELFDIRR
jgi:FKBP-type peptidyl-prolyl cis-trans isomerase FkpA